MQKSSWLVLSFCAIVVAITSCGPSVTYEGSVLVSPTGWHKDTVAVFKSEIYDLGQSSHVLLKVENTDLYSYSNIWFFVDAVSPSGQVRRDTLECLMANPAGDWYGKKSWGSDVYRSVHPYKLNIRFPEKGTYKYYVVQGMRDTVLTGITGIGIKIIETN